jgi:hypothetical protein
MKAPAENNHMATTLVVTCGRDQSRYYVARFRRSRFINRIRRRRVTTLASEQPPAQLFTHRAQPIDLPVNVANLGLGVRPPLDVIVRLSFKQSKEVFQFAQRKTDFLHPLDAQNRAHGLGGIIAVSRLKSSWSGQEPPAFIKPNRLNADPGRFGKLSDFHLYLPSRHR